MCLPSGGRCCSSKLSTRSCTWLGQAREFTTRLVTTTKDVLELRRIIFYFFICTKFPGVCLLFLSGRCPVVPGCEQRESKMLKGGGKVRSEDRGRKNTLPYVALQDFVQSGVIHKATNVTSLGSHWWNSSNRSYPWASGQLWSANRHCISCVEVTFNIPSGWTVSLKTEESTFIDVTANNLTRCLCPCLTTDYILLLNLSTLRKGRRAEDSGISRKRRAVGKQFEIIILAQLRKSEP